MESAELDDIHSETVHYIQAARTRLVEPSLRWRSAIVLITRGATYSSFPLRTWMERPEITVLLTNVALFLYSHYSADSHLFSTLVESMFSTGSASFHFGHPRLAYAPSKFNVEP
ncbi:MAG: hypothetical protein ACTHZ5_10030 [Micrococcaceae bacterium]